MPRLLLLPGTDGDGHPAVRAVAAWRHTIALGLILAAHLLLVFLVEGRAALFGPMVLLVMYLAGFLLLGERSGFSLCILAVGVVALAACAASVFLGGQPLAYLALSLHSLFELLLIAFMLAWLFRQRHMPFDNIMAGIIVFLFMAGLWAQLYAMVTLASPGAVRGPDGGLGPHPSLTLYYFSIVTLTTAGFGDVTPISDLARMLTAYEALVGQVYLVVFIALLMGRHFAVHAAPPSDAGPTAPPAKIPATETPSVRPPETGSRP